MIGKKNQKWYLLYLFGYNKKKMIQFKLSNGHSINFYLFYLNPLFSLLPTA